MKVLAILIAAVILVSMIGFVSAQETDNDVNAGAGNETGRGIGTELSAEIHASQELFREGNYTGTMGKFLNVKVLSGKLREIRFGNDRNKSFDTDLNLSLEKNDKNITHLIAHFENRSDIEVKIMPDTASENALARLRLHVCNESNNCTIQLKEVGKDKDRKVHYNVKADKDVKILGFMKAKMHVESEVDANTGEVTSVKQPWWAAISSEQ